MHYNINVSFPLESLNNIIIIITEKFWQMKVVAFFQAQVLAGCVVSSAFVVIYNPSVFNIDVVPFILTHFANLWCLSMCLCLQLFLYLFPFIYCRDHVHPWIDKVLQIYVLFVLIIIQCKHLLLALIAIVLP